MRKTREKDRRRLLETTGVVPWEASAKTWQFIYVGPQAVKLLGYPVAAWYQKDFWVKHLHPDDRKYAVDFCLTFSCAGKDFEFEYRMIASDQNVVWLHDLVSVELVKGVPEKLRGYMIDITERKRAQEELDQYRRHLEATLEGRTSEVAEANRQLSSQLTERKRAEEVIRQQIERLTALREMTLTITSTLDLTTVLENLLEKIEHLLPYHASSVRLFDRNGEILEPIICRNLDVESWKARQGSGFVREIIEKRLPVTSIDVRSDPRSRGPTFFRKHGLVSFIGIPLIVKDQPIGVLSLYTRERHEFSGEEIEFLTMVAAQAAIAIHNSKLYEEIHRSREELRELTQRMNVALEEERSRLARQVHDELGQPLVGLKMELAVAGEQSDGNRKAGVENRRFFDIIDSMLEAVRTIGTDLRSPILDDLGLGAAVEYATREFHNRTGLQCQFTGTLDGTFLDPDRSTAVFRILQEALSNVARHAQADSVVVELQKNDKNILLTVNDNGKGLEPQQLDDHNSLGIIGMRERAVLCRGELNIRGVPGQGTTISLRVPLP